jgi:transposase
MTIPFAGERKSYSKQMAMLIVLFASVASMSDVAKILNISWHIVKEVVKAKLLLEYGKPDLSNVRRLSIDEISVKKRHTHLTVVINADNGQPLFIGDGKGEVALEPFWAMLGPRRRNRVEAVAIDMGKAYISAVTKNLPNAKIVFDHFHLVKLVNDSLNKLRLEVLRESAAPEKKVIKGVKYVLLANREDVADEPERAERLQALLDLNTPLSAGYILKEDIRQIWKFKGKAAAERALDKWIGTARATEVPLSVKLADTVERHKDGILNWYDFQINSGLIEGVNNKIKVMKRRAYGFHDMVFLNS